VRQAGSGCLDFEGVVMINTNKPAVALLALSGLSDLAAAPLLFAGRNAPPTGVAVAAAVLALVTFIAAVGLANGERWARPLGIGSRALDVVAIAPAAFGTANAGLGAAAAVTAALSVAAIVAVARTQPKPALDHGAQSLT
jgi:hypothetical protein